MLVDWSVRQKKQVLILLGLILILTSSFLTYEWTQYAFGIVEGADPERLYSRLAKTLTSFLVFLMAIRVGDAGINQADPIKLKRAFMVIFLGDLLFLMDEFNPFFDYLAVLAFLAGQVLMILRNGQGLRVYWQGKRNKLGDILMGAAILVATGALFFATLYPYVRGTAFLYIIRVYALILDLALWTAWMSLKVGYFPRANAWLILIGATCFFIGDYIVGFNLSLSPSLARVTTMYLTARGRLARGRGGVQGDAAGRRGMRPALVTLGARRRPGRLGMGGVPKRTSALARRVGSVRARGFRARVPRPRGHH